jgi:peptidoglycan/LPS O-acetylase OafA/YrhL
MAGWLVLLAAVGILDIALGRNIGLHMSIWGNSLLAAFYALAILLCVLFRGHPSTRVLRASGLLLLARISYGVYLVHGIMLITVFEVAGRPVALDGYGDAALMFLTLILTISVCIVSHRWLENPIQRFGYLMKYT